MVASPSINIKPLFLFFSNSVPIANQKLIISTKSFKISGDLLSRNSQDPLVSSYLPKLQSGTWKVEAVLSCEKDIKINQVCGNGHHNRHRLVYTTTLNVPKNKSSKHYQRYIFHTFRKQLMKLMPSPKLSNCRFKASGQDG